MDSLIIKKILKTAQQSLDKLQAVYLFGSYAYNMERSDSDIDLAFFGENKYSNETMYNLSLKLSEQLNKDFDCIDLQSANNVFAVHIIDTGKTIFNGDKNAVSNFEMRSLSQYAKLNEERKDIIQDILVRGSIYGK